MAWRIEFDPSAEKELGKLGREQAQRILKFLSERVAKLDDPRGMGEALKGSKLGAFWKYRVGDYRIIADIQDAVVCILVVRIGNRRDVYKRRERDLLPLPQVGEGFIGQQSYSAATFFRYPKDRSIRPTMCSPASTGSYRHSASGVASARGSTSAL
jgi:mRNA interferase RelE/StbE